MTSIVVKMFLWSGISLTWYPDLLQFSLRTRYKWWKWLKGILVSHFWRRKGFVLAGSFRRGEDVMKGREPGGGSSKMGDHTLSPHRKQRERGQEVRQAIQLQSQLQVV